METPFVLFSLLAGGLLPAQAGANARLSKTVGNPFLATTLQLLVATVLLLAVAGVAGSLASLAALPDVPRWHVLGGLASALYVLSGILLFPRLGAVVTVGLFIAGQILASVALDASGALGVAPQDFGLAALAGTTAVCAGTAAIVLGQEGAGAPERQGRRKIGWVLIALAAGAILPVQGAVNALLRADLGAPLGVGVISFAVATLAMALVFALVSLSSNGSKPRVAALTRLPWWGWLGGFVGATYVVTVFTALPAIGAALCLPKRPVSALRLLGVAVLLAGVGWILAL